MADTPPSGYQAAYQASAAASLDLKQKAPALYAELQNALQADGAFSAITNGNPNGGMGPDVERALADIYNAGYQADSMAIGNFLSNPTYLTYLIKISLEQGLAPGLGAGAGAIGNITTGVIGPVVKGLQDTYKGPLSGYGAFFQPNLWVRVAEVALGVILIAVGVARMTNAIPAATKIARYVK